MKFFKTSLLALTLAMAQTGFAATESMSDRSEAFFLDAAGPHAVAVAPHLYRVEQSGGVRHFAFGTDAVQTLNTMVTKNLERQDPAAARRFADGLAKHTANTDKASVSTTICGGDVIANLSATAQPGFTYHSASASGELIHTQSSSASYSGSVYATAMACVPLASGVSCQSPYGQTARSNRTGTLSPINPRLSATVRATNQGPSFMFSRLESYVLATCGSSGSAAVHNCMGDDPYFNSCP